MQEVLDKRMGENAQLQRLSQEARGDQSTLAGMLNNSPLIKSYELTMQQYEIELEKKSRQVSMMEAEQQQIGQENVNLSH